jgi:NAD(P)-dependent dehydrogenase (short-subunit alcohol dehydrogenase family)
MRLKDKIALIVGGASGMGAEISRLFVREGARVVIADINEAAGRELRGELEEMGGKTPFFRVDVTAYEQVRQMVDNVVRDLKRIDILINAVGTAEFVAAQKITPEQLKKILEVNLAGIVYTCQLAGKVMIKQGAGKIVNFGSTAGVAGAPYFSHYTAAKHGVVGLTRALAVEWGKYKINVNCICPGATETSMFMEATTPEMRKKRAERIPLRRFAKTIEQAQAALFLASGEADYITGAVLCVDGGAAAMSPATGTDVLLKTD